MKKLNPIAIQHVGTTKQPYTMQTYRIKFLGEGGVGKTSWIRKIRHIDFNKSYVGTVGSEFHPHSVVTNHGTIQFTFMDYYGKEEYASPNPIESTDATVLMFDLSRKFTHTKLSHWHELCGTEPVFLVGNKSDLESVVTPTYHIEHDLPYVAVSAKTGNMEDLFIPILRRLTGHNDLVIQ